MLNENVESRQISSAANSEVEYDYEEILKIIGFGKSQWIVLFVGGILLMTVINETMGMSIITLASQCDFQLNSQQKAIMSAATFVGILSSSYFLGYLSDTRGRRAVLIKTTLIGNFFSLMSMFVSNFWVFVVLRFLTGVGLAGASSTVYAFIGEYNTHKNRPIIINYASMFVGISTVYSAAVAWVILPQSWIIPIFDDYEIRPWRLLIFFNMIPGFLDILILSTLPESPQFLIARSKNVEAMNAIQWICDRNHGKNSKLLQGIRLKCDVKCDTETALPKNVGFDFLKTMLTQTRPLLKQPLAINFLICCVIMFGLFLCSAGLGLWYPEIQNRISNTVSDGNPEQAICQVIDSFLELKATKTTNLTLQECDENINMKTFVDAIMLGMSYVAGYIVLGMVLNRLGRKRVLVIALTIAAVCGASLHWVQQQQLVVFLFCSLIMLPGLCISILSGAVVDLIPTQLRGKAVCICLMLGRSGSIVGSNFIGFLLESYCRVVFDSFAVFILMCAVLASFLPI